METVRRKALSMIFIVLALTGTITASLEDDEKECAEQMTELAACIPFVSGTAKQPTKECCDDTNKVRNAKPKCLCVLIKESSDPSMGLPINTTLALQMPAACNIDAKVSDCPCNLLYILISIYLSILMLVCYHLYFLFGWKFLLF